ncbi:MAG: ankyrin repeat domain-containing protein [Planctomycetes bacterium]|nr:ankyrin repeat domain-containing protein [Planctomycetota bacterium]
MATYLHAELLPVLLTAALAAQVPSTRMPLHDAVRTGNLAEVTRLLDDGAAIDAATLPQTRSQRDGGLTALMLAASLGEATLVRLLVDRGAALDLAQGNGWTALDHAFASSHDAVVAQLAKAGASITSHTFEIAARQPARLQVLFAVGADANAVNERGETVLHHVAVLSEPKTLEILLAHGASWHAAGTADHRDTPLARAASWRLLPALRIAQARGALADPRLAANDRVRVLVAVLLDDEAALVQAIAAGAEVEWEDLGGATPLQAAAELGRAELVPLLVTAGAALAPRPGGRPPAVHRAAAGGHLTTLQALLQAKTPLAFPSDRFHGSALQAAATFGHLACAATLLSAGAAIDFADDRGTTPLLAAVDGAHGEVVDLLLRAGADPNRSGGSFGQPPLHLAAMRGQLDMLDRLLRANARVDAVATKPPFDDATPLMAAVRMGHLEAARRLLAAGADRSLRSPGQRTALDFADTDALRSLLR